MEISIFHMTALLFCANNMLINANNPAIGRVVTLLISSAIYFKVLFFENKPGCGHFLLKNLVELYFCKKLISANNKIICDSSTIFSRADGNTYYLFKQFDMYVNIDMNKILEIHINI